MKLYGFEDVKAIYMLGIGGVSMNALAKWLLRNGYQVSGSDAVKSEKTEELVSLGVNVFIGEDDERKCLRSSDLIVYTDAIPPTHTELVSAKKYGKRIISRADLLQAVCRGYSRTLAVAGSHGKTTCTSMCAHVLRRTGVAFTAHIGGDDLQFGNFYYGGEEYFLTEACEYKKNILKVPADGALLLNIDKDHMDCYEDEEDLRKTFLRYCQNAKTVFVCADDERCLGLGDFPCFGIDNPFADYRAREIKTNGERYSFLVEEYGKTLCRVHLSAMGRCNIYNALATFALMRSFGFHEEEILRGVEDFKAVKRRFERLGVFQGASIVCDYAHHPREIFSTLKTARNVCKGKLFVVFQPHTYSRTKSLMQEFVSVLRGVENLMVYKTFPARERYDEEGCARRLAQNVGGCLYADDVSTLKLWLTKTVDEGDMILFLGAGDIYYVAQYLLRERL